MPKRDKPAKVPISHNLPADYVKRLKKLMGKKK